MRTLLALSLIAAAGAAAPTSEKVAFKLPSPDGRSYGVHDFKSRYLLLVYQGIP